MKTSTDGDSACGGCVMQRRTSEASEYMEEQERDFGAAGVLLGLRKSLHVRRSVFNGELEIQVMPLSAIRWWVKHLF